MTAAIRRSARTRKPTAKAIIAKPLPVDDSLELVSSDDDELEETVTPSKSSKATTRKKCELEETLDSSSNDEEDCEDDADDESDALSATLEEDDLSVTKAAPRVRNKKSQPRNAPAAKKTAAAKPAPPAAVPKKAAPVDDSMEQSDEEDDDIVEEDIGKMFQKVRGRRQSREMSSSEEESDDSDSDSDCDSNDGSNGDSPKSGNGSGNKRAKFSQRLNQQKKKAKFSNRAKQVTGGDVNSDSDSDSECEIVEDTKAADKLDQSLDLLSDSEDEKPTSSTKNTNSKFAKAYAELKTAQAYKADDLKVPEPEEPKIPLRNSTNKGSNPGRAKPSSSGSKAKAANTTALGSELKLTLRTQEVNSAGMPQGENSEMVLSVRQKEPLEELLKKYLQKNNLTKETATVTMFFDGMNLFWERTPESYEMEKQDLVDVKVLRRKQNLGQPIQVKLRMEKQEQKYQIRMKEPLRSLLDKYVVKNKIPKSRVKNVSLHFDGEKLGLDATPESFDMESGELIDVHIKK